MGEGYYIEGRKREREYEKEKKGKSKNIQELT